MADFSELANKYEKNSLVQRPAGEILLDMLDVQSGDKVLDLGCGTGHMSSLIRYLSQRYYRVTLPGNYVDFFRDIVRRSFLSQADAEGGMELTFNRIHLVAVKEEDRGSDNL